MSNARQRLRQAAANVEKKRPTTNTPTGAVQNTERDTAPSSPPEIKLTTTIPGTLNWQGGKAYYTDTSIYPRQVEVHNPLDVSKSAINLAATKAMEESFNKKYPSSDLKFTNYKQTSAFGKNNGLKSSHNGIDYATPMNTPVGAIANGTVIQTGNVGTYGNLVKVRYEDGNIGYYSHLNSFNVKAGDKFRAGDILGTSGNTGRSTGPHLHLEVRGADDSYYNQIDPQKYIDMYNPQPYKAPEPLYYDFKTGGVKPSRETPVEIPISDKKTITLNNGVKQDIDNIYKSMSSEAVKQRNLDAKTNALVDYLTSGEYNNKVGSNIMNGKLITPESLRYKLPIDVTKDVGNEKRPNSTKRAEVLKSEIEKMGLQGEELKNALDYAKAINPTVGGDIGYAAKSFLAGGSSGIGGVIEGMVTAPLAKEIEKGANGLSKAERFKEIAADYMVRNLFPSMKPILNAYKTVSTSIRSLSKMYYTEERAKENGFKNVKEFVRSDIEKMYGKTDFFDKPANELAFKSIGVSDGAKFIGEISQVVGNMIPSIIASVATKNPEVGLGIMARSTMGQSANEALKNGATAEQAYYNGLLKGATEYLTEKMFGGIPLLGKGLFGSKADDLIAKLGESSIGKFLKSTYGKAVLELLERGGEGLEEAVSGLASGYIDRLTYDDKAELATASEIGRDAFLGILVSFVMNAPMDVVKGISNIKSNATKTVESYPADVKEITPAENTEAIEDVSEILIAEDVDPNKQIEEELYKMIENGNISSAIADQIASDTQLRSGFERMSNVSVEGSKAEKRNAIKNWVNNSQNIENLKLSRAGLTSDHARVVSLLENPNSGNVRNIIKIPKLAQAFQELTGVDLEGDLDAQRNLVKENAEQAILNYNKAYETGKPLQINTNDEILTKVEGDNRKAETENIEAELTPPPSEPSQTAILSALPKDEPLTPSSDKSDNISKLMKGERVNIKDMSADEISRLEEEYGFKIKKQKQLDNIADRKALELRLKEGEKKLDEEVFGNDENTGLINDNSGDIIDENTFEKENNNEGRKDLLSRSGKWESGESAREQTSAVVKGTRGIEESKQYRQEQINYVEKLKTENKVVRREVNGDSFLEIQETDYTDDMRSLVKSNQSKGVTTIISADGISIKGTNRVARGMRAVVNGKPVVVVQWNHQKYTPQEINEHELVHENYSSDEVQKAKNDIFNDISDDEWENILETLKRDHRGVIDESDIESLKEEFVANVLSGMNTYGHNFEHIIKSYKDGNTSESKAYKTETYAEDTDTGKHPLADKIINGEKVNIKDMSPEDIKYLQEKFEFEIQTGKKGQKQLDNLAYHQKLRQKSKAPKNGKKYSYSSISNEFFNDKGISTEEFEKMLKDESYKEYSGYQSYLEKVTNVFKQSQGMSSLSKNIVNEIERQIKGIMEVALASKKAGYDIKDVPKEQRTKRDSKKRLLFSSLEPNSEYITSSDISTICDKRKNFTEIYEAIVRFEDKAKVPSDKRFFNNVDNYFILHKIMADKGLTAPCRECYVESMRKNLAPMAKAFLELVKETNPNNKKNAQLYNQSGKNKGQLKSNNAKLRERVRNICENAGGNALQLNKISSMDPEQLANFGEAINNISFEDLTFSKLTTATGLAELKLQSPELYEAFNSFYGQSKPKLPKEAVPFRPGELIALMTKDDGTINTSLVKRINKTGGFRLQSYSDFQIQNFVDVLQTLFEASMLGLHGHAYTKVPAFLEATKGTNLKRNMSIFMYNDNGTWKLDKANSFPMDLSEMYNVVKADKQGDTGIIAVSQNADMSAWIMANNNIDYGIPFHKSGLKMKFVRAVEVVNELGQKVFGYKDQKDHTRQQSEVYKKTLDDKQKANSKVKEPIDIYEFWDFDNKEGLSKNKLIEKNLKAYIDKCNEKGYYPKFREYVMSNEKVLKDVLKYSKEMGYVSQKATVDDISFKYAGYKIPYGYYKFLGDFAMFTPDGKASPIRPISLNNYDFKQAQNFFKSSETLRANELLQQFENGKVRDDYRKKIESGEMSTEELSSLLEKERQSIVEEVAEKHIKTKYSTDAVYDNEFDADGEKLSKGQIKSVDNLNPTEDIDIRYSTDEPLSDLNEKYGTIPKGEKPARDVSIPKRTDKNKYVSYHARTLAEAGITSDEFESDIEKEIMKGTFSYEKISDETSQENAQKKIERLGFDNALKHWENLNDEDRKLNKNDIALGQLLYNNSAARGDYKTAMKLAVDLVSNERIAAQNLQAARMIKKMSPDGKLYYAEKMVQKINQEKDKNQPKVKLDEELVENLLTSKDSAQAEENYQKLVEDVALQMDSNKLTKFRAWRYMAMLLNPTTHIRNVMGNTLFVPVKKTKDVLSAVGELAFVRDKSQRTKSLFVTKEAREFANKDYERMKGVLSGNKYNDGTQLEKMVRVYKNKWLNSAYNFTMGTLSAEDAIFKGIHYRRALAEVMTARGWTEENMTEKDLEQARTIAINEALKATFNDESAFAKAIGRIQMFAEKGTLGLRKTGGVIVSEAIDAVIPFKSTPTNIAKRGILEYSPIGVARGVKQALVDVKRGTKTASEAIDMLASGLTGTAIMALGAMLFDKGIISMESGDNDKEDKYLRSLGKQGFALNIGDKSYSLDWMTPASLPLFAGANIMRYFKEEHELSLGEIVDGFAEITQPLYELSMLSSINDLLEDISYADNKPNAIVSSIVSSYITQYFPTVLNKVSRTLDTKERKSYYDKNNPWLVKDLSYLINNVWKRIPGLAQYMEPSIDIWGNEIYTGTVWNRVFANFISPGYLKQDKATTTDKKLLELYERTGETAILPSYASKDFELDGDSVDLTALQYTRFSKTQGKTSYNILKELFSNRNFDNMTDTEKISIIKNVYEYSKAIAKVEVKPSYKEHMEKWMFKMQEAESIGIPNGDFLIVKKIINDMSDNKIYSEDQREAIMQMEEFTPKQKSYLDQALINPYRFIKDDAVVDYTNNTTFILTQMSEAAQRKKALYPDMSAERYKKLYEAYSSEKKKADKIKNLVEAGMTYTAAEKFYETISKK